MILPLWILDVNKRLLPLPLMVQPRLQLQQARPTELMSGILFY